MRIVFIQEQNKEWEGVTNQRTEKGKQK